MGGAFSGFGYTVLPSSMPTAMTSNPKVNPKYFLPWYLRTLLLCHVMDTVAEKQPGEVLRSRGNGFFKKKSLL